MCTEIEASYPGDKKLDILFNPSLQGDKDLLNFGKRSNGFSDYLKIIARSDTTSKFEALQ